MEGPLTAPALVGTAAIGAIDAADRAVPSCWEDVVENAMDEAVLTSQPLLCAQPQHSSDDGVDALHAQPPPPSGAAEGPLRPFLDSVLSSLPVAILPAPSAVRAVEASLLGSAVALSAVRRSKHFVSKKKQVGGGTETTSAVQELLARACGIIAKDGAFDDAAKAAYLKLFNSEIAAPVIQAIDSLIKQVKKVQKNGKGKGKIKGKKSSSVAAASLDIASV
jgi:hypothetical protein